MAPPRKHGTDVILDAARALVLDGGPRAASVAAIAKASGAPAGTLYHRFGSRDGILTAAWLRALERFQTRAMAARGDTPLETAVAMAVAAIGFARELPEDARLLLTIRPGDLLDAEPDAAFNETLAAMNAPLTERLGAVARELYGRNDARAVDAVARAVADLPYAVVRRHAHDEPMPPWLEGDVAAAVRAMLKDFRKGLEGVHLDGIQ
ncbi:TetR/AcrR family transcriptional regulator [Mycobacterium sp. Marseille-P9652]|uniref:TetR/AcrR family transcriptional regulator n=1 Tax=Mycobacterium sp. Marseille-P9652 TaxID=2654950 RepID=UPI0012E78A6B|nr:TetR/AcrR family transcriptional regulator [Mycobacterium sp. Marseille-P9652]